MKPTESYDKLRGGYYTPAQITEFIVDWAIRDRRDRVLEPSCGSGNFLEAALHRFSALGMPIEDIKKHLTGVELDKKEAEKAKKHAVKVVQGDFFSFYRKKVYPGNRYDVVIGNPPFIRYQNFNEKHREEAFSIMKDFGFQPNKLTNTWLPFLVLSSMALTAQGRIGMVIPAELFQVDYASEVRLFLSKYFEQLTIVTFRQLVFDDIQQEVVLLLGERASNQPGIRAVELENLDGLKLIGHEAIRDAEVKTLDHSSDKWTKYFLTSKEIQLLGEMNHDKRVSLTTSLFDVNVGLVSGENKFFILNKESLNQFCLRKSVLPIISKSEQLKGIKLSQQDFGKLEESGKRVYLFAPPALPQEELRENEQEYVAYGEDQGYHKNYKCSIRKQWYVVPQSWKPEAFILRQVNLYPKIVLNQVDAQVTDTIHKLRFQKDVDPVIVAGAFLNSYTLALSETIGRSYGGGVLTFEPGEIRRLRIPMQNAEKLDFGSIDALIRQGKIEEVLQKNDEILLKQGLGLSEEQILELRNIWIKLRDRRINRKKSRKNS